MAEDIGGQFAKFGEAMGDAFSAGPKAELEAMKMRKSLEPDPPDVNQIYQGMLMDVFKEKDPKMKLTKQNTLNDFTKNVMVPFQKYGRAASQIAERYGPDVLSDETKPIKIPIDPDFFDDPPMPKDGWISDDPDYDKTLQTRWNEKKSKAYEVVDRIDPDALPELRELTADRLMDQLKQRDEIFKNRDDDEREEGLKKFKTPSHIDHLQMFQTKRVGNTYKKVQKRSKLKGPDKEAHDWAMSNKDNPKAKTILQKLKSEGKI